ncbi:uncharacterized protein LOC141819339 [Curcuma longa]|uniref:uncharacterized protein LOC141819339 n=1 Tax=Curcuma longa TaxID=136217 RepID=UPI003D9F38D4
MSEEANKFLKIQACVLKVNICCDGCQKKVRRVLQKIEGVCTVTINEDERKVTVTGAVDPAILINKLNEAGKHAEVWPTKGGNQQNLTDMLQKLKLDCVKVQQKENGKSQKGGGGGGGKSQKGGSGHKEQKQQKQTREQGKGFKDLKFPNLKDLKLPFKKEDNKKVKFNLPSKDNKMDDGSDYSNKDDLDEFDDEDLDDMYDEFGGKRMIKPNMKIFNQLIVKGNDVANRKKRGGGKGANLVQVINKVMGGKNGGGGGDGKQNQASGTGRRGHGTHESKNGGGSRKNKGGNQGNHDDPSSRGGSKRGGESNNGVGLGLGRAQPNMMMGQMGGFPLGGMPLGYFQPGTMPPEMMMANGNHPYYQQQYLQALMQQQQQQRMMMAAVDRPAFPPVQLSHGYGYSRPVYIPQPPQLHPHGEPYLMFSDENPNSCSVM